MRGTGPLRLLGHEADRPHPAGELARRGHVRLVAVDPAREQRLPPLDQPPHALGGMPAGDPVRGLAPGEVLRPSGAFIERAWTSRPMKVVASSMGAPSMNAAWPPRLDWTLTTVGLIRGLSCSRGSQCFYVLLISSLPGGERARPTPSRLRAPPIHSCRNLVVC